MKLYTLHIHMFAMVMSGTLHVELAWLCPAASPWLPRPHCRGYARRAFSSMQAATCTAAPRCACKILVVNHHTSIITHKSSIFTHASYIVDRRHHRHRLPLSLVVILICVASSSSVINRQSPSLNYESNQSNQSIQSNKIKQSIQPINPISPI